MSQATWEEVKRLAADLQRAQLSDTVQRLSDRNCIEIVNKLVSLHLLEIVYTVDGKAYLTEHEIGKEIREELQVHGGRVNLVYLQTALNIDYSHIEAKVNEIVRADKGMNLILGQLLDRNYLDTISEDINDYLHEHGQVTIAELTKTYDLPASYVKEIVNEQLGEKIFGRLEGDVIFTDKFVQYHRNVIKGAFCGLTRPKTISTVIAHYKLQDALFHKVIDELIKSGDLAGLTSGGKSDKALYIPNIYCRAQNRWVEAFFKQNGYLELDAVTRLGISDAKGFVKKLLKSESVVYLKKCCVGKSIQDQVSALVDEALRTGSWVDVQQYLPSCLSVEDSSQIINSTISTKSEAQLCAQTVVVSQKFIKNCQDSFVNKMDAKATEDIRKNPNLLTTEDAKFASNARLADLKEDRRDQRKKKQAGASKTGGGTQGREVKMKNTKNKYRSGGMGDDDDDVTTERESFILFMSKDDMEESLQNSHPSCPPDVVTDIVESIHRPLSKQYHQVVKERFLQSSGVASGSERRKTHAHIQEKISSLWSSVKMFEKSFENFPEEVSATLNRHLLSTLCSDITNTIFKVAALDNMISTENDNLSPESRIKLLSSMSDEDLRKKLSKLNQTLSKSVDEFCTVLEDVCGPNQLSILLRKVDKKKERQIVHGHRIALLQQLEGELDPALCLHLAVVIMYQSVSACMLHAPGKCVPHIITYLSEHVEDEKREFLLDYQNDIIKSKKVESEDGGLGSALHERIPQLKEMAATFKKSNGSK